MVASHPVNSQRNGFVLGKATDVLVVGAGPTGLMAATTLAHYGINVRIIDKRPQKVPCGHASGVQPRTLEIMNTLGLHREILKRGGVLGETAFWSGNNADIKRADTSPETEIVNATPFPFVDIMHQGDMEDIFIHDLAKFGVIVGRPVQYITHDDNPSSEYPVTAYVKLPETGVVEMIPTKYMIGCDGALSAVRTKLGFESSVHHTEDTWVVADTQSWTDFPDWRRRSNIRTESGSVMFIPNPNNGIRLYTLLSHEEVKELSESRFEGKGQKVTNETTLLDILVRRVKKIIRPYSIDVHSIEWISMYHISQRVCSSFANQNLRVFIAGDSCHTHSPKAAQGMNVSMNDTYNLTWKLALVLRGLSSPKTLLPTYQAERQHIAHQLIAFDEKFSHLFAHSTSNSSPEFHDVYTQNKAFTSGTGHHYPSSLLVATAATENIIHQVTDALKPGTRMLPFTAQQHLSGARVNILDDLPASTKFHIFAFCGTKPSSLDHLAQTFTRSSSRHLRALVSTPDSASSLVTAQAVDIYFVHTIPHLKTLPEDLFPRELAKGTLGSRWEDKVYDDQGGKVHRTLGVDVEKGAVAVVRPDGYVGLVTRLDGVGIEEYIKAILDL